MNPSKTVLVLDDGHPTHPKWVGGPEVVVTVTRPKEERPWWMRLLNVYPPTSVVIDVRRPGDDFFVSNGSLAHGGSTTFKIRSIDRTP